MQIINTSLHQINHSENKINKINISNELNDMQEYIKGLFDNIKDNNNKRAFDFCGNTTEIRHSLSLMLDEGFDSATEINALRLLRIEIQTQEKYSHITEVQKGILVQFLVENGMEKKIIISKADHNDFLDEYGLWFLVSIDTTKDGGMKMEIEAKGKDWQLIGRTDSFDSDFQRVELPKRFLKTLCLYADIPEQKSLEDVFSYLSYQNVTSIDVMEAWQPSLLAGYTDWPNAKNLSLYDINWNIIGQFTVSKVKLIQKRTNILY
jgi:hypothetical protein